MKLAIAALALLSAAAAWPQARTHTSSLFVTGSPRDVKIFKGQFTKWERKHPPVCFTVTDDQSKADYGESRPSRVYMAGERSRLPRSRAGAKRLSSFPIQPPAALRTQTPQYQAWCGWYAGFA